MDMDISVGTILIGRILAVEGRTKVVTGRQILVTKKDIEWNLAPLG
ncbi:MULTISPECIES: hypothetical protein [unclassified Microbulbifer]|nr:MULTISPECIES: hypothetical protein [unclassified Microbulbifer]